MSNIVKYLAPWHKHSDKVYWRYPIKTLYDDIYWKWRAEIVYRPYNRVNEWEAVYRRLNDGGIRVYGLFTSFQEAKIKTDQKLLELGYVFLTKEQYERLRVLL
jgi:hypothetical protein